MKQLKAISSPLLEETINGATGVLLNVSGGESLTLHEVNDVADIIYSAVDPEANILFGSVIDEALKDEIMVTVIATGFNPDENQFSTESLEDNQLNISNSVDNVQHQENNINSPLQAQEEPQVVNVNNSFKTFEKQSSDELIQRRKSIESMKSNDFSSNFKSDSFNNQNLTNDIPQDQVPQFVNNQNIDMPEDDQLDVPPFLKNF